MQITSLNADTFRHDLLVHGQLVDWKSSYTQFPCLDETAEESKWDNHALTNTTSNHPVTRQRIKQTLKAIIKTPVPGSAILDFGVGYGDVAKALSRTNLDFTYHGVDISQVFVDNLRADLKHDPRFTFDKKDLFTIPAKKYDLVLALEVLEHISPLNIFGVGSKLRDVLKIGGKIVVSVPLFEDLALTTANVSGRMENSNGHVRSYTPQLICSELREIGFTVDAVCPVKSGDSLKSRIWHSVIPGRPFNVIVTASSL